MSSRGGGSKRLQGDDKANVKLAVHYHRVDILENDGWPASTERKDTLIGESLSQANAEAAGAGRSSTDMTASILDKVRLHAS